MVAGVLYEVWRHSHGRSIRDDVSPGGAGSEFSVVFEDTMTTREDEGVLVSLLSATTPTRFVPMPWVA